MMECVSKDTIEEIVEPAGPVIMKHRGRPTRYNDDGTVNTKPIDPDYFEIVTKNPDLGYGFFYI